MLKLGVIGFSEGNGHPFSWSAIFNGFDYQAMLDCGYPVIPEYLSQQNFPKDFLCDLGKVTHVYSQNIVLSEKVQKAALVENLVETPEKLIGAVDAILLARDDAENHLEMTKSFIEAGIPIFIDKPFALTLADANAMLDMQNFDSQIFTCSSLRYANELLLGDEEKEQLGEIKYIEASIPKYWKTYAVHLIEPIIVNCKNRGGLKNVKSINRNGITQALVEWEDVTAYIKCTGHFPTSLSIVFYGVEKNIKKTFHDSFSCFKSSLYNFISQTQQKKLLISRKETLEIVEIIEKGING